MAITPTLITSGTDITTSATITSPTFNTAAGCAYVVFACGRGGVLGTPTMTTSPNPIPNSPTPTLLGLQGNSSNASVVAFLILCGDTGTGRTVTVDFGISTMARKTIFVVQIPFSTFHAVTPIINFNSNTGGTSVGITVPMPAATSTVLGCVATVGSGNVLPANSYTELTELSSGGGTPMETEVSYMPNPNNTTVAWSGLTSGSAGLCFEIVAAETVTPMRTRAIAAPVGDVTVATAITSQYAQPTTIGGIILAFASCRYLSLTTPTATFTSTGLSITGSWSTAIIANDTRSVAAFSWALIASLNPGFITCTFGAAPDAGRLIAVGEIIGQETVTTPIKQTSPASNSAPTSPFTATLGSTPDGDSEVLGFITNYLGATGTDVTPVAGTEIIDGKNQPTGNQLCLEVQRLTTPAAAVSWNPVNASRTAALAIEIDKLFVPTAQPHGQKVRWM